MVLSGIFDQCKVKKLKKLIIKKFILFLMGLKLMGNKIFKQMSYIPCKKRS